MDTYRLYKAIGDADEELLARCEEVQQKPQLALWKKTLMAAACICIVFFGMWIGYRFLPLFHLEAIHSGSEQEQENAADTGNYVPSEKIVGSYEIIGKNGESIGVSSCYAAPEPGEWIYEHNVSEAMNEYAGENVLFFVSIAVSSIDEERTNNRILEPGSLEMTEELKRLTELGYQVGYAETWTYHGKDERFYYTYAAGYLTEEQLRNFEASEQYGYFFGFATDGDGKPVDAQEGIVRDFDSGEGVQYN